MKKRVKDKKKVVGAIGLATAAVCCIGVASTTAIANGGLISKEIVNVYADDTFTTQWNDAIAVLKRINGDITTKDNYVDYLFAYIDAADAYARISATVTPEDYIVYERAGNIIRADADCYRYFTNSLSKLYKEQNIRWSDKTAYDSNVAHFNSLDEMEQNVIIEGTVGKFEDMCSYGDSEFARIQGAMNEVVVAIKDIKYVGMVDSKVSLENVASKIKAVYGVAYEDIAVKEVEAMAAYLSDNGADLTTYDNALKLYNDILKECKEFDDRIIATYNSFTTEEGEKFGKYYTERLAIEELHRDYVYLNKGANDDRTTLINESAKIFKLVASVKAVDTNVFALQDLIRDIPADFDYTDAYTTTVKTAREYYENNIIDDLKAVVEASDQDAGIQGYVFLCEVEGKIEECKTTVENLIERAKNLEVLYNEGSDKFSSEVNGVARERAKLTYAKQKADFDAECGDLLFDMQTNLDNLSGKIGPFIDAVLAIGEVKLSNTLIGAQIETAYVEYAKLTTTLEQNAVLGYKTTLDQKKAALDELMAEANEWKAMVETIVLGEKINTQNIADINAVEEGLNQIKTENLDMYTVISTSGSTYGYSVYEELISAREGLFDEIEQLASDMDGLSTDLSVIVADPTAFNQAVVNATDIFGAFDDTVKEEYFIGEEADNKDAYDNYVAALNIYEEVAKLAGDIASLYDVALVDMTKYEAIVEYNASYENLSDENKEILNTQKINDDKTFKEVLDVATEKVNALKLSRDSWAQKVYALAGEIEKANWENDLYSVNLATIEELKEERVDLDNTDGGLDEVDADFALIEVIGDKRVTDLNSLITELDAKEELEKSDVATLESIYDIYNNKLDQTQKDLVNYSAFEVLYNKYVFAQNFDEAVLALYEDVVSNGNYTSEVPVTIGILRSIYINFGSEMKALIQEYARIEEIEAEYNAHVESEGGILNLTAVYNELSKQIADINGADFSAQISELVGKITAIEKAYADADTALKDALEKAYVAGDEKLSGMIVELQGKLDEFKANLEKADADIVADIAKVREELAGVKEGLEKLVADTKTELLGEIELLEKSLADAKEALEKADADNKAELESKIDALTKSLADAKVALEEADADIVADIAKVREELAGVKESLEKLVADTKTELLDVIGNLRKSLTTVSIILSIVSGLTAAGVIILFINKKKN